MFWKLALIIIAVVIFGPSILALLGSIFRLLGQGLSWLGSFLDWVGIVGLF